MAAILKKLSLSLGRGALGLLAALLTFLILTQIALWAALAWLGTGGGQSWVREQVRALAGSAGYDVAFAHLSYDTLAGLVIRDLRVNGPEGKIAAADIATVRANLFALAARHASAGIAARNLTVYQPASGDGQETQESAPFTLAPFDLPELFIRSAMITLAVERLDIRAQDETVTLSLSPALRIGALQSGNKADLRLWGSINHNDATPAWMPQTLRLSAAGDSVTLYLSLRDLLAANDSYRVDAQGQGILQSGEPVALRASVAVRDMQALAGMGGTAALGASVGGTFDNPALYLVGDLALNDLIARGLDRIRLDAGLQDRQGTITLSSQYRDMPVTIASDIGFDDAAIRASNITLTASEISGNGDLSVSRADYMATGNMSIKAGSIAPYAKLLAVDLSGSAELSAALTADTGTQAASAALRLDNGRYDTIRVARLEASASLPDLSTPVPDALTLKATTLALAGQATFDALSVTLTPNGDLYAFAIDGNGRVSDRPLSLQGSANLHDLRGDHPAARDIDLSVNARRSALRLSGEANLAAINITAKTDGFALRDLPVALPDMARRLSVSGSATVSGPMDKPLADIALALSPLALRGDKTDITLSLTGRYDGEQASAAITGTGTGINTLNGQIALPLTLSLYPFAFDLPRSAPLHGNFALDMNGQTLARLFLPLEHRFSGRLTGRADIGGTLETPALDGTLALNDGYYGYETYGVALNDLTFNARFSRAAVTLNALSAHDGGAGRLTARGAYDIGTQGGDFSLTLTDYALLHSDTVTGSLSAGLSGDLDAQGGRIGGTVTLGAMNINLPERFRSNIPELNIVDPDAAREDAANPLARIALAIDVAAANRLFVRGWGLDAEFGGKIEVDGTLDDPQFNGELSANRGRYDELGQHFELEKASLRFQGSIPPSPYIDVEAVTDAGDITATIMLKGPVTNPGITLASTPVLPQDEILARILFGRNMDRVTPFQAVQLAQTLRRFSGEGGGGGFDPLGTLRSVTGLDDIRVDTDSAGETSVGAGKYLTDKVYLEVEKGRAENSGAASLQIEVTPNITLESEIGQDAQAGGGVFWRWDY